MANQQRFTSMMSRRSFIRGAVATGAMLALAGSGSLALADEDAGEDIPEPDEISFEGAVSGGRLNFYLTNPTGIEPFDSEENQGVEVAHNLFDTLVTWDWGNQTIAPLAAESWEVNEDATVYTFHLRQDAKFHNGQPVTSADFKYSWERICRADFTPAPSSQGYKVEQILGANEMMNGEATELAGVECPDDYTLVVTLRAPYGDFLLDMTDISSAPIPNGMGGPGDDYQSFHVAPVGNGPFMMDGQWADGQYIMLKRFDDYWGEKPYIDGVNFQIYANDQTAWTEFEAGNLDFTVVPSGMFDMVRQTYGEATEDGFLANPGQQYFSGSELSIYYLLINNEDEVMSNKDLRLAVSAAINRQAICTTVFQGSRAPADNILMPGVAAYEAGAWDCCPAEGDKELAAEYFDKAGYPLGDDGKRGLSLTLSCNSGSGNENIMQMIQADLAACGVDAVVDVQEWAAYLDNCSNGNFQMGRMGWVLTAPNAYSVLADLFVSGGPNNYSRHANPEFDEAINAACQIPDEDERNQAYKDANAIVAEDFPVAPLMYYTHYYVASSRVHNMFLNPGTVAKLNRCWLS